MIRRIMICAVALTALWGGPAVAKRVALVVGNATYAHERALKNPPNDARDIADALRAMGF